MNQLSNIRAMLVQQLTAYQNTDIAWENVPLEPVPDNWLRFSFFQDAIDQAEFGTYGRNRRQGTVQVSVFGSLHKGIGPALDKASDIETVFPRGWHALRNGVHVRVMRTEIEHQIPDERYFHIPVSVYWLSYTNPVDQFAVNGKPLFMGSQGGLYTPLSARTDAGARATQPGDTFDTWLPYSGDNPATAPSEGAEPTLTE